MRGRYNDDVPVSAPFIKVRLFIWQMCIQTYDDRGFHWLPVIDVFLYEATFV